MNLDARWLGLSLPNPIVAGASPLSDSVDMCRRLEDEGIAAVVMHSLFMEQIAREEAALLALDAHQHAHPEASSYLAEPIDFALGPDEYLEQVYRLKQHLGVPVIGSLNGTATGQWTHHARLIEQSGADGLELNLYYLPLSGESPAEVERRHLEVLAAVRAEVSIPVAMKLSFFFTSPVYMAKMLAGGGAAGLVFFNRIFHPHLDVEDLEVRPDLQLRRRSSLSLRLLWVAAAFGKVDCDLAISGGVVDCEDVLRSLMAGANCVQMTSALLAKGPGHVRDLLFELRTWMRENDYESVEQMRGSLSVARSPDPEAYERANYMRTLNTWEPGSAWYTP